MTSAHLPVLLAEVIQGLDLKKGSQVVDCTLGGGGHAESILKNISTTGRLLGIDADNRAIERVKERLQSFKNQITFVNDNFSNLSSIAEDHQFYQVDAVLIDLGWSSDQLYDSAKGFSFQTDGPLDLRYDVSTGQPAYELLNRLSADELTDIFKKYGEEEQSKKIAKRIVVKRLSQPFKTVFDLLSVISPLNNFTRNKIHPATKIWQALRIAVNDEFTILQKMLPQAVSLLKSGGRLAIISFHSGEDRIVKQFLKKESQQCICPPSFPVCRCQHVATLNIITKKAIKASSEELKINPRARSASLRIAQKK